MMPLAIQSLRHINLILRAEVNADSTALASFLINNNSAQRYLAPNTLSTPRSMRLPSINSEIEYLSA